MQAIGVGLVLIGALGAGPLSSAKGPAETSVGTRSKGAWEATGFFVQDYPEARLLAVLVTPERYIGKKVTLTGVLSLDFEDRRLYLSKDEYAHALFSNALSLQMTDALERDLKFAHGKYAEVSGRLIKETTGIRGPSAIMVDIRRVLVVESVEPRR